MLYCNSKMKKNKKKLIKINLHWDIFQYNFQISISAYICIPHPILKTEIIKIQERKKIFLTYQGVAAQLLLFQSYFADIWFSLSFSFWFLFWPKNKTRNQKNKIVAANFFPNLKYLGPDATDDVKMSFSFQNLLSAYKNNCWWQL